MSEPRREALFRYLTAEESVDYIAVMGLFTATLLTDLSAEEVASALGERAHQLPLDTVESRCRQLITWGNLVPSIRDARVATVADYLRSRSRYQVSKLGGRVHREAMEILHAADGAREVARELLGRIVESLDRILVAVGEAPGKGDGQEPPDVDALAGEVTTVFNNQRLFTASVRDFYAYLAGVLSRYDLGGDEYSQFKNLLLDYVDLITADVNRHAPAVSARVAKVLEQLDPLLAALASVRGLRLPDGTEVERGEGRTRADWKELAAWYGAGSGVSGPEQLRAAAGQALGQLLTNAKRLLDASGTGFSRRADLLRLARWFAEASDDDAHRIFAATFVAYPARHLLLGPEEPDPTVGPTTSWWQSTPVAVPVSLRERGDRAIRGRASRVPDTTADRWLLVTAAEQEAAQRRSGAAELAAAGRLGGARVSPAARGVLLDLLADLLANHRDRSTDLDVGLTLTAIAGSDTVVHSNDGTLTVVGLELAVQSVEAETAPDASAVGA